MRLNIITTTWITILALAAVLISGFSSGAQMMNSRMGMPHDMQSISSNCLSQQMSSHNSTMVMQDSAHEIKDQCEVVATDMVHHCCDTTCATSLAILATPNVLITASSYLAPFHSPGSGDIVYQSQSLYRPPIA